MSYVYSFSAELIRFFQGAFHPVSQPPLPYYLSLPS
ncbi:hypothetical protein N24_2730 [Corynebacterium suranareeae]|uniref:Uncharacterized protein n=1 Tax=Corynebacterium suranareeae TaxID=2506452 RepID=A0A169S361_9CORY|nr:hypothetical protein N24_2730 [Corynebacterium suranareeae]